MPGNSCDVAIPQLPRQLRPGDCFACGSQCPLLEGFAGSDEGRRLEDEDEEKDEDGVDRGQLLNSGAGAGTEKN
jgi:hypothetical protein